MNDSLEPALRVLVARRLHLLVFNVLHDFLKREGFRIPLRLVVLKRFSEVVRLLDDTSHEVRVHLGLCAELIAYDLVKLNFEAS